MLPAIPDTAPPTRGFLLYAQVHFNAESRIVGGAVNTYLLEKSRVVHVVHPPCIQSTLTWPAVALQHLHSP